MEDILAALDCIFSFNPFTSATGFAACTNDKDNEASIVAAMTKILFIIFKI
jgi:hypothetical protein